MIVVLASPDGRSSDLFDHRPVPRRLQIADDALQIGLSHPGHDRSKVDSGLEVSRGESRSELVKPEVFQVQTCPRSISFEGAQHMSISSPTGSAED